MFAKEREERKTPGPGLWVPSKEKPRKARKPDRELMEAKLLPRQSEPDGKAVYDDAMQKQNKESKAAETRV